MLWPSISRWKFQRSRIGRFTASVWCLTMVCSATTPMLITRNAASHISVVPRSSHRREGTCPPSQSTMRPRIANSAASKIDMTAVSTAMAAILPRTPCVQAQRNAKKPCGGSEGSAAG